MQKKYKTVLCVVLVLCIAILVGGVGSNMALYDYLIKNDHKLYWSTKQRTSAYDSANDILFVVYSDYLFATGSYVKMSYSTDKGQTWTEENVYFNPLDPYVSYPSCSIDSSGNLHVTWKKDTNVYYRKRDSLGSWGSEETVGSVDSILAIAYPHTCVNTSNQVYAVYVRRVGGFNRRIQVARRNGSWSVLGGGALDLPASSNADSIDIQIVGDTIHATYISVGGGNYTVYYATFNGTSWSSPTVIDGPDATARTCASIAVNSSGNIYITWIQGGQVWGSIKTVGWSAPAQVTSESQACSWGQHLIAYSNTFRLVFNSRSADPGNPGVRNIAYMEYNGSWGSKTTLTTLSGGDEVTGSWPTRHQAVYVAYEVDSSPSSLRFVTDQSPVVAPSVTSCSPNHGPAAGGTSVTIGGSNFAAGATVKFGTVADGYVFATSVVIVDANTITCVTPAATGTIEGLVDIVVTNPGPAEGTLTNGWTYGPTISSISPSQGPLCGGLEVTVTGTGLQSGLDITFNGELADNITYVDEHTATCDIPEYAGDGLIDAVVTNPDGEYYTLVSGFNYSNSIGSVPAVQPPGVGGNGYGFSMLLLDNAGAGTTSITVKLAAYTHYMVVANFVGGTGKVRVEVSNDETNFGIRGDITNDGYLELKGFRYLRVTVISGTVDVGIGLIRRLMWNEGEPRERSHYSMKLLHGILYPCGNDI